LRFPETKQVLKEDQVPGAAYGQKFREALDDPQYDGVDVVHGQLPAYPITKWGHGGKVKYHLVVTLP